jgi:choline dehydrogenase
MNDTDFDYIVIGSGAAGSVVANRLSADPAARVLVLEAGDMDTDPRIAAPATVVELWGSELDWKLMTEPQPGMNGRQVLINQGRVLGGGTSIHALMYVRGNRRDYDRWSALGNDGWSYDELLPYFRSLEDYAGGASPFHGVGGPLPVRDNPDEASHSEVFMRAAVELGFDGPYWDINGARQENGAGLLQFTTSADGQRASAAGAFLHPVMARPNLTVQARSEATRLLLDGTRVTGVEYLQDGQRRHAAAAREVIVCAGALLSPRLLMLSGIGPADHLRSHGINAVADLPGVGQNLQDHVQLSVVYRARQAAPLPTLLTGNVLFVDTRHDPADGRPDLQLNFTPAVPAALAPLLNLPFPAGIFLPILVQPRSIGQVRLRSADPLEPPVIDPNYLQDPADVQTFVAALELIRSLAQTQAFAEHYDGEIVPGPDVDLEEYIRAQSSTLWHPTGTCRMGNDPGAVVDARLRVHGIEGLRVADASIMPTMPSGNTQAACFMIGEKLADLIIQTPLEIAV